MKKASASIVLLLCLVGRLPAEEPSLRPFPVDWNGTADSPASVAFLLETPAGKDGFVRVADGHLARPDGRRLRLWGVNATGGAGLPPKTSAPSVAAHLARCGVNCVRLHFLDAYAPRGLVDPRRDDTQRLDPEALDRLDFFIAELKKHGIYSDLNLNVARAYKPADGVRDCELLGYAKALTYFDPRLIELQRDYDRQLLTHRNPYTGHEYRDEPAVAIVELVNENSIVESWICSRLLGKGTQRHPGTWTDIPASYEKALTELYNRWLESHVAADVLARLRTEAGVGSGPVPRLDPPAFAKASKVRFRTEAEFYVDLERTYFRDMGRYLRGELGVKPLLLGTGDHSHGKSGYPLLASTQQLDIVDGHVYWQHPKYLTDSKTGKRRGFEIENSPMVNDPLHSSVVSLSRSAVAGKPYTVSEVNHPFPSEYSCEGIPILAAYAALNDWDGIFWYTLGHDDLATSKTRAVGHFDIGPDPVKMSQLVAGAMMFLRADVRAASRVIGRSYSHEQVLDSLRLQRAEWPYFTPGFPLVTPLVHSTRITSLAGPPTGAFENGPSEPICSDTGELTWLGAGAKQGLVTVDTDRSQAIVGFCRANGATTRNLAPRMETAFCALTLSAMDDRPIARSQQLLLTATAKVANSAMRWNDKRTSLDDWGKPPACIEPVRGTIVLRGLDAASRVSVQPLDGAGRPLGPVSTATKTADGWSITIGEPTTTWYVLMVDRSAASAK